MTMRFTSLAALAVLTLTGVSAPVFAQSEVRTRAVQTADLDLSKDADVATLHSRIKRASHAVCGGNINYRDLDEVAAYRKCQTAALTRASGDAERVVMAARSGERTAMTVSAPVAAAR